MYPEQKNLSENFGLKLKVKGTGILEMDPDVIHPFVRIHIVDLKTNKYLAKSERGKPGVTNLESVNFFKIDPEKGDGKIPLQTSPDFLLPMST